MDERKLYRYLEKLSKAEWADFGNFLASPILGNSPLYCRFLEVFCEIRFEGLALSADDFHRRLYPKEKFPEYYGDEGKDADSPYSKALVGLVNRHLTGMLSKLFDYWGFKEFQEDKAGQLAYRLKGLARLREVGAFEKAVAESEKLAAGSPFRNSSRLLDDARHALQRTEIGGGTSRKASGPRFQSAIDDLDAGYLVAGLDLICKANNHDFKHQKQGGQAHRKPRFLDISRLQGLGTGNSLVEVLLEIYRMSADGGKDLHYRKAKTILMKAIGELHVENAVMFEDLFGHLINFAARQERASKPKYRRELQELYEFALSHGVFVQHGHLSANHYQNIATTFMDFGEFGWVEVFLMQYKDQLPKEVQEPVYHFNLAVLQFRQQRYSMAKQSLVMVENIYNAQTNREFTLQVKAYLLVMEYTCEKYEHLYWRAQGFITWLKNERGLRQERLTGYLRFARIIRRLGKVRERWSSRPAPAKLAAMREEVAEKDQRPLVFGKWLRGFMDEIMPSAPPQNEEGAEALLK